MNKVTRHSAQRLMSVDVCVYLSCVYKCDDEKPNEQKRSAVKRTYNKAFTFSCVTDLAHTHRLRRQALDDPADDRTDDNNNDDINTPPFEDLSDNRGRRGPKFSPDEFGEKLKELLDRDRPDRKGRAQGDNPWAGDDIDFEDFFDTLEELAERIPDDLNTFDADRFLSQVVKPGELDSERG